MKRFAARSLIYAVAALSSAWAARLAYADESHTLTIGSVMRLARERAATVREARAVEDLAEQQSTAALAGYLPTASVRVAGRNTWARSNVLARNDAEVGITSDTAAGELAGTVSWTAWDSLRTPRTVASLRAGARAAGSRARAASQSASALAAQSFLEVLFDDARVEVARATVQLRERHSALAHGLVAAGIRPPVEEARAVVQLEAARAETISLESQSARDRVELATLLQLDPTAELRLVRPALLPKVEGDPALATTRALRTRPELSAARDEVHAREEALAAAESARLPTLTFHASALTNLMRTDVDPRFLQGRRAEVGVTLSLPIFDWTIWSRPSLERATLAVAVARTDGEIARVRGEAAIAAYRTRAARALLDQAKRAAEVAAATLAVVERRYQSGLSSPLELVDSGTSDAAARRQLVDAELELATATVQVLAATGRIEELEK